MRILAQKEGCEPFSRRMFLYPVKLYLISFHIPVPLDISHVFTSKENDWGFSNYTDWAVNAVWICVKHVKVVSFLTPFLFRN